MPLPIPRLDDRTYADLVAEAVARIPVLAPEWTNHNPSDPGITLLELLAWRVEMLLYRTDQVPPAHVQAFLALLDEPASSPRDGSLDDRVRATVLSLRDEHRAVTGADYERLVTGRHFREWLRERGGSGAALPAVLRAHAIPRADLTRPGPQADLAGHLSLVVVPAGDGRDPAAEKALCGAVHDFLDERRLLGTWHHVVAPSRLPLRVRVVAVLRGDTRADADGEAAAQTVEAVRRLLAPTGDGEGGGGWPLGRPVFVSELYAEVERLRTVDYVPLVLLEPAGDADLAAREIWNDDGQLVGVRLQPYELPRLEMDAADVHLARDLVPVTVQVGLRQPRAAYDGAALGGLRTAARLAFPPLRPASPPDPQTGGVVEVEVDALRRDLLARSGLADGELTAVQLLADPSRLVRDRRGATTAVRFRAGELAAVNVDLVEPRPGGAE